MKNNEAGEFEMVLGNKQLLSGFFVVVILFAVFFVMGYIVGRNSSPQSKVIANSDTVGAAPAVSLPRPPTAPAVQSPPPAAGPAGDNAARPAKQPTTQPAREPARQAEKP